MSEPTSDAFARKSAARAWQAVLNAQSELDAMNDRLLKVETNYKSARYLRRCSYCGEPTLDVVCRSHWDLLEADPLAPRRFP